MSGIYGYISTRTKKICDRSKIGLREWNRAYGNLTNPEEKVSNDASALEFFVGVFKECFKASSKEQKALVEANDRVSVIDSLIYRREENEKYDEEYIHGIVSTKTPDLLVDVIGDFSGITINEKSGETILFRDHMGVRPLYYYCDGEMLVFSTEIRGLLATEEVNKTANEEWLYSTLMGSTVMSTERTEFEHIYCVPPGGFVTVNLLNGKLSLEKKKYWIPGQKKIRFSTDEEYYKELRTLTEDAVRIRMNAIEGKIGAEFSGGLDSSIIGILLHRFGRECKFFSWVPGKEDIPVVENDERIPIFDICDQEGIECEFGKLSFGFDKDSELAKNTPLNISDYDWTRPSAERFAFPVFMNTMEICETADHMHRSGVTAVFSGHGGDEGISHRCTPYELFYNHEYYQFLRTIWRQSYGRKNKVFYAIKRAITVLYRGHKTRTRPFEGHNVGLEILSEDMRKKWKKYKGDILTFGFNPTNYIISGGSRDRLDVTAVFGAFNRVRYIFPYVDYRLIDFALGIPRYLYLNGGQNRYIFRKAFQDLMPKSLFRLQNKLEISVRAYKESMESPNAEKKRMPIESRELCVNHVNRDVWKDYVDFAALEEWASGSSDEKYSDAGMTYGTGVLFYFENVVKKSSQFIEKDFSEG